MSKETAKKWLKQAQHDLEMAEKNIAIEGYDVASFLSHQAVEKLLKCILILEEKEVPRTHQLDRLGDLTNVSDELKDKIIDLTEDYTLSRYPDVALDTPYMEYDLDIARKKVDLAKDIFQSLKQRYDELET